MPWSSSLRLLEKHTSKKVKVSLDDLDGFKSFEWMMTDRQMKQLKVVTDQVCAAAGVFAHCEKGDESSNSGSKAAAASKKRKAEVQHAAAEMFA